MDIFRETPDLVNGAPDNSVIAPEPVDSVINVTIADDGFRAYINIEPPHNGGAPPTFEALQLALAAQDVTYNVDMERLKRLAEDPVYNQNILIASGRAPVDGIDGALNFHIETEKKELKPKVGSDGRADYYDLGIVENVTRGQVLCTIVPPTEGSPGITVQGREIPQRAGRAAQPPVGRNTELSADGKAVVSKIDGQVEFDGRRINVTETLYIKGNVDFSTGNISANGNVVIQGAVLSGFKVEATGNLEIRGVVENAQVRAGGNIKLQSGIIGSSLYCGGELKCRYIENSAIFAKKDIRAESIINSDVKCGKSIRVSGSIAKIIGGSCFAGQDIEARTIGSISHVKTNLEIGTDEMVIERQQELKAKIAELEETNKKLVSIISTLCQLEAANRLSAENKQILDSANYSYNANNAIIEAARKELDEINQAIKEKGKGRVICTGGIYPGVRVEISGACLNITELRHNVMLYVKDGEITIGSVR